MLQLHFANRLESLADGLVARLGDEGRAGGAFEAAQVIVPSAAMQRHLTLALARAHGVCANVDFSFLAGWLWAQIVRLVPGVAPQSPFDPEVLAWRVLAAFGDTGWTASHPRLDVYLRGADPVMRYELAARVAGLFDQYLAWRPDWLEAWADGRTLALGAADAQAAADEGWQAALWRRLVDETLGHDPAARLHPATRLLQALAAPGARARLPRSAHVFCLPAMPPVQLERLRELGRHMDVHVYALNPCREFWFEVVDRKRLAWLSLRGEEQYHEEGNRLLAAWGRQAQAQLGLLAEAAGEAVLDDAQFVESARPTLLGRMQDAILDLVDLEPGSVALAADDRSLEIHACHSLTRELEVLHDRLLALFAESAADPRAASLQPADVLVVLPDLEAAAPLVDAVFGTAPPERRLPHAITGRARSRVNEPARALLELLALASSRFAVSAVFGLLQQPVVARRFGLAQDELVRVHSWLQEAGVHWGLDAAHRASLELPALARHSFGDGLDRLFLGYALPDQVPVPFDGRLPAGGAESSDALTLGAFWRFVDALAALRARLAEPLVPALWPAALAEALASFVAPADAQLEDLREVHAVVDELAQQWSRSEAQSPLPLDLVRTALAHALDDAARGGVPTGAITFAAMQGLRNLPYRVVCVLGLDDGAFPTATRPAEFDLMARAPRRGDRQRRTDERNVFLDLLLAARERLHLSYVGRSVRDNAVLPPSVLVAELLDVMLPAIVPPDADAPLRAKARARLVVEHPLQPFSERAFRVDADEPRLRSFHREYAEALRHGIALAGEELFASATPEAAADFDDAALDEDVPSREAAAPFLVEPLPAPGPEWRDVPLERLARFFRNPCRYLLEQRLGLELRRDDDELQDDEPWRAQVSGRSPLLDRLLPAFIDGMSLDPARTLAQAGAEVPDGAFGRHVLERELRQVHDFAQGVRAFTAQAALPTHVATIDLEIEGEAWRVHGAFADLRPQGLLHARYARVGAGTYLDAWLAHLLLCASAPAGVAAGTTGLGRDARDGRRGRFRLRPCADARAVLATLVGLYARGLREPLPFFPRASWALVEQGLDVARAAQEFRPAPTSPAAAFAESADAGVRLALRGRDPFGPAGEAELVACARAVFDPLRACLEPEPD